MPTMGLLSGLVIEPRLSASPLANTLPAGVTTQTPSPVGVAAAAATLAPDGAELGSDAGTPSRSSTTLPPTTATDDDGELGVASGTAVVVVVGDGAVVGVGV